jgi:triosephosphate isomerase (TIM)
MPHTIVAGNWKMHKTAQQTREYFAAFIPLADAIPRHVRIVVAPPFTALQTASEMLHGQDRVVLGAQNVHWEMQGAYTGEVSIPMLAEFGVQYVIVGHSERRAYFDESNLTINLKVKALLANGMTPIVAVGETIEERNAGITDKRVIDQTKAALEGVATADVARVVMAYEPVWAIGTGANCDPVEANRVMSEIRSSVHGLEDAPILYGGSMKPDNVRSYAAQANVNGGLVGGASLDPTSFAALIEAARE